MPEVPESPLGERERIGRRAVPEVRQDCKAREAAQQERSRAHAGEPGSASSGVAVRSASRGPALAQPLSADTVEPGSASSSQVLSIADGGGSSHPRSHSQVGRRRPSVYMGRICNLLRRRRTSDVGNSRATRGMHGDLVSLEIYSGNEVYKSM